MNSFPHFPLYWNAIALFGLTVLLGLIGGELAYRSKFLPRITGYLIVGFLVGTGGFNIVSAEVLFKANIFIEISLSLILFELGRHLDFTWLKHDNSLLKMALTESSFTFFIIFIALKYMTNLPTLHITLAATLAIATSPAVLMMVALDMQAEGPVSRRAFMLTSLNNLIALLLFTFLLPIANAPHLKNLQIINHALYSIGGAVALGLVIFYLTKLIALLIGKQIENQFVLLTGAVVLTIGLATALKLPATLTLFILGVAARNLDPMHLLMEIDFGWFARILFILLFVVTGAKLQLHGLYQAAGVVFIYILARGFAKFIGIKLFTKSSRLTSKQSYALGMTLMPMSSVAIGMFSMLDTSTNTLMDEQLLLIIAGVVTILNIIGPILTQLAFIITGEGAPNAKQQGEI